MKVCFAASSGGHLEQLMMLSPIMDKCDAFILTEAVDYTTPMDRKCYFLKQVNRREKAFLFLLVFNAIKSLYVFIKEKPDAIVCTGVLSTIPMFLLCKLFKKKTIYIESFAKVTSPTETGRFLYKYADRFYVQWESMLDIYPNAVYVGGIY